MSFLEGCQHFRKKGIFLSIFTGKGLFSGASSQRFLIKGVFFSSGKISDRGIFLIWRTIIRAPFYMGVAGPGVATGCVLGPTGNFFFICSFIKTFFTIFSHQGEGEKKVFMAPRLATIFHTRLIGNRLFFMDSPSLRAWGLIRDEAGLGTLGQAHSYIRQITIYFKKKNDKYLSKMTFCIIKELTF